jgi:hypothetical protein
MSYYGTRAAVGDFASFGFIVMILCGISLLFTLGVAIAFVWGAIWILGQIGQPFYRAYCKHKGMPVPEHNSAWSLGPIQRALKEYEAAQKAKQDK